MKMSSQCGEKKKLSPRALKAQESGWGALAAWRGLRRGSNFPKKAVGEGRLSRAPCAKARVRATRCVQSVSVFLEHEVQGWEEGKCVCGARRRSCSGEGCGGDQRRPRGPIGRAGSRNSAPWGRPHILVNVCEARAPGTQSPAEAAGSQWVRCHWGHGKRAL